MLVEVVNLKSPIVFDKDGLSLVLKACDALSSGLATAEDLWPGETYELSS